MAGRCIDAYPLGWSRQVTKPEIPTMQFQTRYASHTDCAGQVSAVGSNLWSSGSFGSGAQEVKKGKRKDHHRQIGPLPRNYLD